MIPRAVLLLPPICCQPLAAQALTLPEALSAAWERNPALQAGRAQADAARLQAEAASASRLPTLALSAGWTRTDEPMQAFGMKLDQARIQGTDFNPAALNHPDPISGFGAGVALQQPLYAGGRIQAAMKAGVAMAGAETARLAHRKQQVAAAVVKAYFATQAAAAGIAYAEETLKSALATEAFVAVRLDAGLALKADLARVRAWRASAEAALVEARRAEMSARSGLSLLMGDAPFDRLATPLDAPDSSLSGPGTRMDLEAARLEVEGAQAQAQAVRGSLKPEVGMNLSWGLARQTLGASGGSWGTASLGAKWSFSHADTHRAQAARASARAAALALDWQKAQARREVSESGRAIEAAQARLHAAEEALQAATEARDLRQARHREGMLPLTELLDAESALAGARALRLASLLDLRVARAESALANGAPIEGVAE